MTETERIEAMETGFRMNTMELAADVIAERILEGEEWEAIAKELHDKVSAIVCGQEHGADDWKAKKEG